MKEVLTYLSLVLADKAVDAANLTLRCLLLALNGATFVTEKPFYQQLAIEGRKIDRPTISPRKRMHGHKMYGRLHKLVQRGFVEKQRRGNRFWYVLTEKGTLYILKRSISLAPKLEDGKLIFVSYDIPEDFKLVRELFRRFLYETGFRQFHKSILICNRDVSVYLKNFIKRHQLEPWVRIIEGRSV